MRFVTCTTEELEHLRQGLQVLEKLNEYEEQLVEIYFYGLTNDSVLLDAVKEAVAYWSNEEIAEQDVNVTEAVIIIPASADVLYYLTGSGLIIRDGEAVYTSGGGEGPRSVYLKGTREFRATVGQFNSMALSHDDLSGEDFLLQYGTKARQPAAQEVQRTEPAQEAQKAPVTGREGVAPAKQSSAQFDLEKWLN